MAIDTVIQAGGVALVMLVASWASSAIVAAGRALHLGANEVASATLGIAVIALFLWYVGYYVAFEALWGGRTPGKRAIGIRVVRDGGYPITFMESLIRNLVRAVEAPLAYVPSIVSALLSSQNKRLGDLAAGTIVVRDRAFEPADRHRWSTGWREPAAASAPRLPGIERLTEDEVALARRYTERSHLLAPDAAARAAANIALRIRPKLGPEAAALGDHQLLVAVAASPHE